MFTKSLAIILLAASGFLPHHCDHFPPGGGTGGSSSVGGSSGSGGSAGTGGSSSCPDAVTLTYSLTSGTCEEFEPEEFTWPRPVDPACTDSWYRNEETCQVTVDRECVYEDVNVAPGVFQDERYVQIASFDMENGGTGTFHFEAHINGVEFCSADYAVTVSVP